MRLGRELLDRLDEVCPPTAAMASVVLALRIVQKKRWSIIGGGVVDCLYKNSSHACTECRGRDLGHRTDKVLIRLSDLACWRRVQIDTRQSVDICSTQLALPSASTLFLFVVVSPCGEEVVLHIYNEQRRRVSRCHDSPPIPMLDGADARRRAVCMA